LKIKKIIINGEALPALTFQKFIRYQALPGYDRRKITLL
jgi:hypothetical protein